MTAALARLDLVAIEIGLLYLGLPGAFYDLPADEATEALAYSLARSHAPELSQGPVDREVLVHLWNEAHAPRASAVGDLAGRWVEGG